MLPTPEVMTDPLLVLNLSVFPHSTAQSFLLIDICFIGEEEKIQKEIPKALLN